MNVGMHRQTSLTDRIVVLTCCGNQLRLSSVGSVGFIDGVVINIIRDCASQLFVFSQKDVYISIVLSNNGLFCVIRDPLQVVACARHNGRSNHFGTLGILH